MILCDAVINTRRHHWVVPVTAVFRPEIRQTSCTKALPLQVDSEYHIFFDQYALQTVTTVVDTSDVLYR